MNVSGRLVCPTAGRRGVWRPHSLTRQRPPVRNVSRPIFRVGRRGVATVVERSFVDTSPRFEVSRGEAGFYLHAFEVPGAWAMLADPSGSGRLRRWGQSTATACASRLPDPPGTGPRRIIPG